MPMGGKNWMPIDWKRASMSAIFTDPKRALLGRFSVTEPWCDGGGGNARVNRSIDPRRHRQADRHG